MEEQNMSDKLNEQSLDRLCASLAYTMGIDAPECAAEASPQLTGYVDNKFAGKKADRIFMYNPDAIAEWVFRKYPSLLEPAVKRGDLEVPFCSVMPSVTPVCFGTMYTGAQPSVHGIRAYEKPVIKIDTLFDALIRAGKKPVIVSTTGDSMSKIFLERNMDYFIYDTVAEVNAKAAEIIMEDKYDFVAVYNKNYDFVMHKKGPESVDALAELKVNAEAFAMFSVLIDKYWKKHNTLVGFAMDHGCHEIDGNCGSHGLDMPEDLNIVHLYKGYPAVV
jgi:hypothetical protein